MVPPARQLAQLAPASLHEGFLQDMLNCLAHSPHEISPKYFYDETGSRLFEQICELPEYYVTRTELEIFTRHARNMAPWIGPGAEVIEFGAGSLTKARLLLAALDSPRRFIAVDISAEHLRAAARQLQIEFPEVEILAIEADFTDVHALFTEHLPEPVARRVGFFPGSTLGNFEMQEAGRFLRSTARWLAGGGLLIGIDLVKDPRVLHAAYNDSAGVTAAFNRNILVRANRELGTNFVPDAFAHYAYFHPLLQRIEMHLLCLQAQRIQIGTQSYSLPAGSTLHTENSQKFTLDGFRDLARSNHYNPRAMWSDADRLFSLHWLESPARAQSGERS